MTKPLWQNERWEIYDDYIHRKGSGHDRYLNRHELTADPEGHFRTAAKYFNRKYLYEAFLQLATYWDLKCDYDELRKIRDEAKDREIKFLQKRILEVSPTSYSDRKTA